MENHSFKICWKTFFFTESLFFFHLYKLYSVALNPCKGQVMCFINTADLPCTVILKKQNFNRNPTYLSMLL